MHNLHFGRAGAATPVLARRSLAQIGSRPPFPQRREHPDTGRSSPRKAAPRCHPPPARGADAAVAHIAARGARTSSESSRETARDVLAKAFEASRRARACESLGTDSHASDRDSGFRTRFQRKSVKKILHMGNHRRAPLRARDELRNFPLEALRDRRTGNL
jgi:hypothetical protein